MDGNTRGFRLVTFWHVSLKVFLMRVMIYNSVKVLDLVFFFRFDGQFINFSDASNLEHKSVLASLWVNLTSLRLLEQIN